MKTTIILPILSLASATLQAATSPPPSTDDKKGWTGKLSTLDGGLEGTVTVSNADTLVITHYKLEDASAPALYWWGSASSSLSDGFRISNKHVTDAATTDGATNTITLDAGKTTADFITVGLWCEKFSANFGQATLAAPAGGGSGSGNPTPTSGQETPQMSKTSAGVVGGVEWVCVSAGLSVFTFMLL